MKLESDILNAVFLCDSEGFCVQSSFQQWFPHLVDKPARSSWKTQMEDLKAPGSESNAERWNSLCLLL